VEVLWESAKQVYAFRAVIPVVPFVLIYLGYSAYFGDRKKAFRLAMDITTALLIGCVTVLFNRIFGSSFGFFGILLMLLLGAGLLGNLQYRSKGRVNAKRIFRGVWRIGFFVMSMLYILFMIMGMGQTFLLAD